METEISITLIQGRRRLVITGDLILLPILLNSLIIKASSEPTVFNPAPEPSTEISIKLLQGRHRLVTTGDVILLPILLNSLIIKVSPEPTVFNPAPEPSTEKK